MLRPSARSTVNVSSETRTSWIASPALRSEVLIPGHQKCFAVLENQTFDRSQFTRTEAKIACQRDGVEPEFGRRSISIDVDVRRLTEVMTYEVYSVRSAAQNRWHLNSLLECRRTAGGSAAPARASAAAAGSATGLQWLFWGAGVPRRIPATLRSSSTSGQWMPSPSPRSCGLLPDFLDTVVV